MKTTPEPILPTRSHDDAMTRRRFLESTSAGVAGVAAAANLPFVVTSHAAPDNPIRVGVIGCGGQGTGAALDVLQAATKVVYPTDTYHTEDAAEGARAAARNVSIVALADLIPGALAGNPEALFMEKVQFCTAPALPV